MHPAPLLPADLGLPGRWAGQRRFVVLDTRFGLGHHFLATWAAWRNDSARCQQLVFIAVAPDPPQRHVLVQAHDNPAVTSLAGALIAAWPPLTPNVHVLDFDGGAVRLLLVPGEVRRLLPRLSADVHAFFADDGGDRRVIAALARLATPGASLASHQVSRTWRDGLAAAGFVVAPDVSDRTFARYAPHFTPRHAPVRLPAPSPERKAVVIGAGIAGACAGASLARLGWHCTVLDRNAGPATGASGNPAALFHGTAHAADGAHARLHRAAALYAATRYAALIASGRVAGSVAGLRRMHPGPVWAGLPADYVELQDHGDAAFYPAGGWVEPRALVHTLLAHEAIDFRGDQSAESIERRGGQWSVFGVEGRLLEQAPVLVLAGAQGNALLMQSLGHPGWPLQPSRGQVTWFPSARRLPVPVTGQGYAVSLPGGTLLCGATSQDDDADGSVRLADHQINLGRLKALTGIVPDANVPLQGRTGWRSQTNDRLPIVGAVPVATADLPTGTRLDQARRVPRMEGLFVLGGLGSRGFTWGPLAGEVLAAWIDGAPMPLEAELLDAIDPARWTVRAARAAG